MPFLRCDSCRESVDEVLRVEMGCGWLAPTESPSGVWSGPRGRLELRMCPGYTCELPDVVDIARLYGWAEKGGLQRSELTKPVIDGIDILRGAVGESEAYAIESAKERR